MLLMQATMFLAQPKRARLLVLLEPIKQTQDNPRVTMLIQGIMFHPPANRARPLVLLEPIKQTQGNPRVTMLIQGITFHPPANRARPLVLLEPLAARLVRFLAPMRCQVILYQFRVNQAQQSA